MAMACERKKILWLVLHLLMVVFVKGAPQVPCLFIFGDSLSDSGNNNDLATVAKANFKPYGIDFPFGPTGRFTNGLTTIDIIGQQLGFEEFIPPFANTSGYDILKGVNYASGAAGILVESGSHTGAVIILGLQIAHHRVIVSRIASTLGSMNKAQEYLSKCLYYVNIGNNDYINNYFLSQLYPTSQIYTPHQYAQLLIQHFEHNLLDLIDVGARKLVIVGLGLVGCIPNSIKTFGTNGSCYEEGNEAVSIFNSKLVSLVDSLNFNLSPYSKSIFINSTAVANANTNAPGFTVSTVGCCVTGSSGECIENEKPCYNRKEYVFWDDFHPTEAWNQINAINAYAATNPSFVHPMDIKQLVDQQVNIMLPEFPHHFKSHLTTTSAL
ncbi:GDSL esterase/lipase At5g45670 [Arachis hypogaea]|uniref:GDSL esterase/lipase At5g45670 n=1 Tax=Arachis hypogaea TaxID=3818 RepID=UPI000DEC7859|nr:GDSL esterase/lipase At5g45670 [Arachis hypogaea]